MHYVVSYQDPGIVARIVEPDTDTTGAVMRDFASVVLEYAERVVCEKLPFIS
jgi:hypothetical protein